MNLSFFSKCYGENDKSSKKEQRPLLALHPGAIYLFYINEATNPQILGDFFDQTREASYEIELFE